MNAGYNTSIDPNQRLSGCNRGDSGNFLEFQETTNRHLD